MENYILILLTILIVLVIAVVYFGYRQLTHVRVSVNKNISNINALQSYLSRSPPSSTNVMSRSAPLHDNYPNQDLDDLSSVDDIDVSDSESSSDESVKQDDINFLDNSNMDKNEETMVITEVVEQFNGDGLSDTENEDKSESDKELDKELDKESEEESGEESGEKVVVEGETEKIEISEDKEGFMDEIDNMLEDTKVVQIGETVKKSIKLTPNSLAKDFEVGHIEISENNGEKYEVVANKNNIKRWKKVN